MQRFFFILLILFITITGCSTLKPADFSYIYDKQETGLDSIIDINGYYVSERECDTAFYSVFMFYPDGLYTVATTSDVSMVADCFSHGGKSRICQYPSWGTYRIKGDTIKTQTIIIEGMGTATIFRDYLILPDKSMMNISDYVQPEKTRLMFMANYPSFHTNSCGKASRFFPLENKRDKSECPYLKSKWFTGK